MYPMNINSESVEWHSKDPAKMSEAEARQAVAYWRGKFEALEDQVGSSGRLGNIEEQLHNVRKMLDDRAAGRRFPFSGLYE